MGFQHQMKFETYNEVLADADPHCGRQFVVVPCDQWQVDDSAFVISEGTGRAPSSLQPQTVTPVRAAIWYHLKSSHPQTHYVPGYSRIEFPDDQGSPQ